MLCWTGQQKTRTSSQNTSLFCRPPQPLVTTTGPDQAAPATFHTDISPLLVIYGSSRGEGVCASIRVHMCVHVWVHACHPSPKASVCGYGSGQGYPVLWMWT